MLDCSGFLVSLVHSAHFGFVEGAELFQEFSCAEGKIPDLWWALPTPATDPGLCCHGWVSTLTSPLPSSFHPCLHLELPCRAVSPSSLQSGWGILGSCRHKSEIIPGQQSARLALPGCCSCWFGPHLPAPHQIDTLGHGEHWRINARVQEIRLHVHIL